MKKATCNQKDAKKEHAELDLIRRGLALPVAKRMNFLRVRLPGGGSCL
jgi:hypothetical protein